MDPNYKVKIAFFTNSRIPSSNDAQSHRVKSIIKLFKRANFTVFSNCDFGTNKFISINDNHVLIKSLKANSESNFILKISSRLLRNSIITKYLNSNFFDYIIFNDFP